MFCMVAFAQMTTQTNHEGRCYELVVKELAALCIAVTSHVC